MVVRQCGQKQVSSLVSSTGVTSGWVAVVFMLETTDNAKRGNEQHSETSDGQRNRSEGSEASSEHFDGIVRLHAAT